MQLKYAILNLKTNKYFVTSNSRFLLNSLYEKYYSDGNHMVVRIQ